MFVSLQNETKICDILSPFKTASITFMCTKESCLVKRSVHRVWIRRYSLPARRFQHRGDVFCLLDDKKPCKTSEILGE